MRYKDNRKARARLEWLKLCFKKWITTTPKIRRSFTSKGKPKQQERNSP